MVPNLTAGSGITGQIQIDALSGNAFVPAPGTSSQAGTGVAVVQGANPATLVSCEGTQATYEYGVAALAPVATPTAFVVIQGSATKTIRIKKIRVAGVATAQGNMQIQLARWSTAGTVGSAVLTAVAAVKHDILDPAATAVVSTVGTANYTTQGTGSAVPFLCDRIFMGVVATGVVTPNEFTFATRNDKAIILRGATDFIVISGNGSAIPAGGVVDISIETSEDNS